jgi:anti-anti-sigma factor
MALSIERVNGIGVVTLEGRLVTEVAQSLKPQLDEYVTGRPGNTVLDMTGVAYVGSYLIGILVTLRTRLGEQGSRLHLAAVDPKIRFVLQCSGLEPLFTYHASRDEALAHAAS